MDHIDGERKERFPAIPGKRERIREFGQTVCLFPEKEAPSEWRIPSDTRVELRNFLSTACIRFAVKSDRLALGELAFWDLENNTFVCFPLHVSGTGMWQKFLIPFQKVNFRQAGNHYCRLAQEYIALHYSEKIHIPEIAQSVHVTADYLSRMFREETGQTLRTYLINYRIEKAKALLSGTDLSLHEIAVRVGFYDSSHFFHTFSNREGMPPGEYRKHREDRG